MRQKIRRLQPESGFSTIRRSLKELMSKTDDLIAKIAARIAEETGDDVGEVQQLLVDDPEEFEDRYAEMLTEEELRFLGMD
jgi:hypothetical protein